VFASRLAGALLSCVAGLLLLSSRATAQPHRAMSDPIGLPMTRIGSGTSWLPDSAAMFGSMKNAGSWMFMLHGSAFAQYVNQGGARGDAQFGLVNWGMVNAMRAQGRGRLQLRAMGSLDAFTVGGRGYPLLLQTGESYRGEALHDRQHPHDLLMEIAAVYEQALTRAVAVQLYVAPAGEPALGPVAFPHRPSAAADPLATLSHHWQDATHVSFGVVTAAVYTSRIKLEGSVFNGREPDDVRTNIDWNGASLDSYSGRLTINPTPALSLSASMGWLADAEKAHPGETVRRAVGSALWSQSSAEGGSRSLAFIVGANSLSGAPFSRSAGLEGLVDIRGRWQLFARTELVEKSGEELVLDETQPSATAAVPLASARLTRLARDPGEAESEAIYRIAHLTVGGVRETRAGRLGRIGVGMRATLNMVPSALEPIYGSRTPLGAALFVRWRTSRMNLGEVDHSTMHHADAAVSPRR
jgi:hypothetical protein